MEFKSVNTAREKEELSVWQNLLQNKVIRFFLSAGVAAVIDSIAYYIIINFVISHSSVHIGDRIIKAHEFSFLISYSLGVLVNFSMTKFIVFTDSTLKNRQQFSRFVLVACLGFFANYGLLKLFVEIFDFWPTFARVSALLCLGVASYYVHRLFTFRNEDDD
ncbi:hypothetical protein Pedsa_0925 [Pseudopedobacter saltans DSM 12145]|uniref:GtrA/DPMS transmembrane domain-containing protein n=1 Tax=Pseudopedobacter saltans (strain ATCC 51119 / DSM 12145 / JCM 21818 / CCUG 39354 / LMG 10337 / NBRC 100064 / NCIMB 13643) TaxID=762903 RepID=F0SAC0_PSESL|nr:GtrA family protein [Pseudopedobacter saltans]ADY51497.1 hypothetical protein Pedsa_0925 [Pseudopedobacter saltans DSM 12145]